jgi:hypothetical protein
MSKLITDSANYRSKIAGEDLSDYQFRFVTLESDNTIDYADSTSDYPYGILQDYPESGKEGAVAVEGDSKVVAAEALSIDNFVATDATGRAMVAVSGQYARGIVVEAAGAAADVAIVRLFDTINTVT